MTETKAIGGYDQSCRHDIPCLIAPWQVLQRAKACVAPRVRCKTPRVQARYPLPFRAESRRVLTGVHGAVFLCFRRSSKSRMCLYCECVLITDLGLCHYPVREAAVEHFGAGVSAGPAYALHAVRVCRALECESAAVSRPGCVCNICAHGQTETRERAASAHMYTAFSQGPPRCAPSQNSLACSST